MTLPVEVWLSDQTFSDEARSLFVEAIVCYKAGAYRAAFLLSYVAMQTVVGDRLLEAKPPTGFLQPEWNSIQNEIRDEDERDKKTYEAIIRSARPIFLITDDLRQQVTYFKNRRNDCAHGKSNETGAAHIEALWLFLRSNLPKLVVGGSEEALIREIHDHFDPMITPPGQPLEPLVKRIHSSVLKANWRRFFARIIEVFEGTGPLTMIPIGAFLFFEGTLNLGSEDVKEDLANYLAGDDGLLARFLEYHPMAVVHFSNAHLVRKLWYSVLFDGGNPNGLRGFAVMLRNGMIPAEQQAEAFKHVILILKGQDVEVDFDTLQALGFFGIFKVLVFGPESFLVDDFAWANRNAGAVVSFIKRLPLDELTAGAIANTFSKVYHPFTLANTLNSFLLSDATKRRALAELMRQAGQTVPHYLTAVVQELGTLGVL
jgi:hypothetical protein